MFPVVAYRIDIEIGISSMGVELLYLSVLLLIHFSISGFCAHSHTGCTGWRGVYQPEKPTLLDYCCLSQGVPPWQQHCGWQLKAATTQSCPRDSQPLCSHYSRLVVICRLWSGSCCVPSRSSNNVVPAPFTPPPGAPWWLRNHAVTQPAGGIGGVLGLRGRGGGVSQVRQKHGNSRKLAESKWNGGQTVSFFQEGRGNRIVGMRERGVTWPQNAKQRVNVKN